jgi:hypothetical protein
MSDAGLASAFLIEKPKTENHRIMDLELLLPALAERLKKRGVTKRIEQYWKKLTLIYFIILFLWYNPHFRNSSITFSKDRP